MAAWNRTDPYARDRGGIVLGWLSKIVIVGALVGLVGFDALAVGTTSVSLSDQGETAARAASETWQSTHNIQTAYDTAVSAARSANPGNSIETQSFKVDQDGTVHLRISREADTLIIQHVGAIAGWGELTRDASARFVV